MPASPATSRRRSVLPRLLAPSLGAVVALLAPASALAAVSGEPLSVDLTSHWAGYAALAIFIASYCMVVLEEFTHMRKSQPVMLAAGAIWAVVAYATSGYGEAAEHALGRVLLEYAELFLFLLAAMTYVNAMSERGVFDVMRDRLSARGFGYRTLFWITGALAFMLSPALDNLTTSLVMGAVLMAVGREKPSFVAIGCINIVVAANAGGAFSPFGDITTLMVWQAGHVRFGEFFALLLPSLANWLVPALLMHFAVPAGRPPVVPGNARAKPGAAGIILLFAITIALAVGFHTLLELPPFLGMMSGLALLKFYGWWLSQVAARLPPPLGRAEEGSPGDIHAFDSYEQVARAEWDTLLFFFGVILCVGALGFCGYLAMMSHAFYGGLGPTWANVAVGGMSAIVDNIPVMVAVLQMTPDMSHGQWLLVTLAAGVGGSLLSIGSAAGVALMGQARGHYTFFSHLRWSWAIALGYVASVLLHMWLNARHFAPGWG